MSSLETEDDERQCWICFGGSPGLISPCRCGGSMKWVHRHCLDRWRVDATNRQNFTHCRHCGFAFQLVLKRSAALDEEQMRERRQRFVRRTISHFVLSAVSLQFALCLLAMVIRAIDSEETLVTFFNLPQVEGTPGAGIGDFWNAIRHHKSTYYLAASMLLLFCVGLVGTFTVCAKPCLQGRCSSPCTGLVNTCHCHTDPFLGTPGCGYGCEPCCQCSDDCCYFCCESQDFLTCECPNAGAACPECSLPSLEAEGCAGALVACVIVMVVAMIIAGIFFLAMAIVAWMGKIAKRYMQLAELRALTREYIVQDLSESNFLKTDEEQPPLQQEPIGCTDPGVRTHALETVERSLAQDLRAVYG